MIGAYAVSGNDVVFICTNEACPGYETQWVAATERDGTGSYISDETQMMCPTCGVEGREFD